MGEGGRRKRVGGGGEGVDPLLGVEFLSFLRKHKLSLCRVDL